MIVVLLAKALICFSDQCYPVLAGYQTPVGTFELVERRTDKPGYGGSVLQFKETKTSIYAVHRVFTLDTKVNRAAAIKYGNANFRRHVTLGCINVEPSVYEALRQSKDHELVIKEE